MPKENTELEERATGRVEGSPFLLIALVFSIPLYYASAKIMTLYPKLAENSITFALALVVGPLIIGPTLAWPIWSRIK